MPDIADKANDLVAMNEELALKEVRSRKPKAEFTGYCLSCHEVVEQPRRWCDADCRDLWERTNK